MDHRAKDILEQVRGGIAPSREDVEYLLGFSERSLEAGIMRAVADDILRRDSGNGAVLLGQIGVEKGPCPGGCQFCAFGKEEADIQRMRLTDEELRRQAAEFAKGGDLNALCLMAMHDCAPETILNAVEVVKKVLPPETKISVNLGDLPREVFRELRKAGATGAYHVCRLGEGVDTKLDPKDRVRTMENILAEGLELYTCLEPIGPEHGPKELVENMFIGLDLGISQHAIMRRVDVSGTALAGRGRISDLRLAQIVAAVELAACCLPTVQDNGVHEPDPLSLTSGANQITAESGINPRDDQARTEEGRGMDMAACRELLWACGYEYLKKGDGTLVPLRTKQPAGKG